MNQKLDADINAYMQQRDTLAQPIDTVANQPTTQM